MSRINVIFPHEETSYLKTARPSSHLQPYVDHYNEVFLDVPTGKAIWHTSIPVLNASICIHLDGPGWSYVDPSDRETVLDGSGLLGHSLDVRKSRHPGGMRNFFVSLKPGFISLLLKTQHRELENATVDINYLFKNVFLEDQLRECESFEERVRWFESFLTPFVLGRECNYKFHIVQEGLVMFQRETFQRGEHLHVICRELAVSYPTLYRYFMEVTGYSPKFCQKLLRFRKGLEKYKAEGYNFTHWQYGFADFSHFVKVTRQLTGMAPGEF
ncbi:transcription regulator [Fulvivirga imtechensis AK7]|uniref:Transcription regulator n=1 Tax=Fulvivirga imtechensis AK7 TaxID=1237149 RepID=L8JQ89_9BACT|nr:helix-turn-helix domain-containing protein [Fulvivirga imtechensis]ELR71121.1 transcription regulator [Fulvivirga imtechensis AK7]